MPATSTLVARAGASYVTRSPRGVAHAASSTAAALVDGKAWARWRHIKRPVPTSGSRWLDEGLSGGVCEPPGAGGATLTLHNAALAKPPYGRVDGSVASTDR